MQIETTIYRKGTGWSSSLPGGLDSASTLVLAFGAVGLADDPQPFADLAQAFPLAVVAGCSTTGEMTNERLNDETLSVAVVRFEHTTLRHVWTSLADAADSFDAGRRLVMQLQQAQAVEQHQDAQPALAGVFVLCDGIDVNGSALVSGLSDSLPAGIPVTGGLAGDGGLFSTTWVLVDGQPRPGHLSAVGLYGERIRIGHGCDGGWVDFGPPRRITRSSGNVLFELDGRPALDLYREYLGDLASGLPASALLFPLSVNPPGSGVHPLTRSALGMDAEQGSMVFAGDVPDGFEARLMRTTNELLMQGAANAARTACAGADARTGSGDTPSLVVSVSCVGRRLVLGERAEEEAETVFRHVQPGSAHIGFYSHGEMAPSAAGSICQLHNQTMTVTVLREH